MQRCSHGNIEYYKLNTTCGCVWAASIRNNSKSGHVRKILKQRFNRPGRVHAQAHTRVTHAWIHDRPKIYHGRPNNEWCSKWEIYSTFAGDSEIAH